MPYLFCWVSCWRVSVYVLDMDGNGDEVGQSAVFLEEDDGAADASAVHAHVNHVLALRLRPRAGHISSSRRYFGSLPGCRPNKHRDCDAVFHATMRDEFGVGGKDPVRDEQDFDTRLRSSPAVFKRILEQSQQCRSITTCLNYG